MADSPAQIAWFITTTNISYDRILEMLRHRSPGTQGAVLDLLRSARWPGVETLASVLPRAEYQQFYPDGGYSLPAYTPPDSSIHQLPQPYSQAGPVPQTQLGPPLYPSHTPVASVPPPTHGPMHSYNPYQSQSMPAQSTAWSSSSSQPAVTVGEYPGVKLARLTNPRLPKAPGGACATMAASFLKISFADYSVFTPAITSILNPRNYEDAQQKYEELASDGDLESESLFAPLGLREMQHHLFNSPTKRTWDRVLTNIYEAPGRYFLKLSFSNEDGHAIGIVSRSSANPNGCFVADVDYGLFRSDDRETFLSSADQFTQLWHDCSRLEIMKVANA
jgi:hypothetical protein